jgi:hypothetical protein
MNAKFLNAIENKSDFWKQILSLVCVISFFIAFNIEVDEVTGGIGFVAVLVLDYVWGKILFSLSSFIRRKEIAAFSKGVEAGKLGIPEVENPFANSNSDLAKEWERGRVLVTDVPQRSQSR